MKVRKIVNLIVVAGWMTLTSDAHAQASDLTSNTANPVVKSAKATPVDKKLARNVRTALLNTPHFDVSNVYVKARGGVVTLSGSVPDGPQIPQASNVTQGVPGVTSVSNHLTMYRKGY